MMICFAKGGIKYSGRSLPRRTSIESSTHAIMIYVVGTLPMSLLAGRFCRQDLSGHLSKEMHTSGVNHVMHVNAQVQGVSFMGHSNQLHLLGPLRSGALMPSGHYQGLQEVKNTSLWGLIT